MSSWHYQIIHNDTAKYPYYYVSEVYENDKGQICAYTDCSTKNHLVQNDKDDLFEELDMIKKDISKYPVLNESEIKPIGFA